MRQVSRRKSNLIMYVGGPTKTMGPKGKSGSGGLCVPGAKERGLGLQRGGRHFRWRWEQHVFSKQMFFTACGEVFLT